MSQHFFLFLLLTEKKSVLDKINLVMRKQTKNECGNSITIFKIIIIIIIITNFFYRVPPTKNNYNRTHKLFYYFYKNKAQ